MRGMVRVSALAAAAFLLVAAGPAPREIQIEAPGPEGALRGVLLAPDAGGDQVVLIIPGSGLTDRDGNGAGGLAAGTYRLLAEGLAGRGIATARIDKRGMFASRAAVADPSDVTIGDYADDTRAWVATLRQQTGARCVWLLGHSEGGLVALATAEAQASDLCGLILVTTPGVPIGELMREQLRANPANAPLLEQALSAIDELEAGRRIDVTAMPRVLQMLFRPNVQGFLIDLFRRDPARMIAGLRLPILVVQGERDLQVSVAQAERLHQAATGAELLLLPDTSHMLKPVTSDSRQANLATYTDPKLPLVPGVVDGITDFMTRHGGR